MQLTKTQEGILNAEETAGGAISNICGATFFGCQHSAEKLNSAVNTLVRINDALRLHFDRRRKTQWVEEYGWQEYETVSFDTREEFDRYALEYAAEPLDPAVSLFDAKIVNIQGETGLLYVLHHIICDAWSMSVLRWQLVQILEKGITPDAPSFREYCRGLPSYYESRRFRADRAYYLDQYRAYREELSAIDPPARLFKSESLTFEISADLLKSVKKYLEKAGVSQFVLLLAAFGICYSKMRSGARCFYVGTTVLNRTSEAELRTIGPLVDDVPVLFDLERGQSAGQAVRNTDEMVFNAFRHHRFNYPMLQEALRGETTDSRLYYVILNYQAEYEIPEEYPARWFRSGTQYEALQIHIDHRNDRGRLMFTYNYQLEKFSEREIERLHRHYMHVLEALVEDDTQPLAGISLMDEEERAAMEALSRGRTRALPDKSLYHLIEEQEDGSIVDGETEYRLSDLKRDAVRIDAAVRREKRIIGVVCERSYVELAAIYGIIRGGNAYLPISTEFPPERIETVLRISGCDTVLAQRKYRHLVPSALVVEDLLDGPDPAPALPAAALPDDLLYVIFTSGSTGRPKGAMVSNRSAVNRILWMADRYFTPETTIMLKTPYTFDVSVWEIFGFALAGCRLYILPPFDHYRQDRVLDHIRRGRVTDIHFVPSVFSSFLDELEAQDDPGERSAKTDTLKNIFLSGEALPAALVRRAPAPVRNLYGPTECAVDVTYYDCAGTETDPVPIGFPIDNCRMYVLDGDLQPVPVGVKGQICIGGVPVGEGYIRDPARTADRFVPDPRGDRNFGNGPCGNGNDGNGTGAYGPCGNGTMYLTGDIGYWNEEGAIEYAGRIDRQVKINGQRIEPEEIETALTRLVPEAAVIVEDNRLIAFYTGGDRPSLRKDLAEILPAYMVPHSFVHVKEMPRMSSGKTDRGALRQIPREERSWEPPVNGTERAICAIFSEVLHKEKVSRTDSFFELGGTSLDMLSLLSRPPLDRLSPPDILTHSSPAELADLLEGRGETSDPPEAADPLEALYIPACPWHTAFILFPFAGGDASAYTALAAEFRKRQAPAALYSLTWGKDLDAARTQILRIAEEKELRFYSHCAGSALALKLLDRLQGTGAAIDQKQPDRENSSRRGVSRYYAGADIPPARAENIWEAVSDRELTGVLSEAGLPALPEEQMTDLVSHFRRDTKDYFDFFAGRRDKISCGVTPVLSRKDLFTQDYEAAEERWSQYVTEVDAVHYIDAATHYFQATEAAALADLLLSGVFEG